MAHEPYPCPLPLERREVHSEGDEGGEVKISLSFLFWCKFYMEPADISSCISSFFGEGPIFKILFDLRSLMINSDMIAHSVDADPDVVFLLNYIYRGGPLSDPLEAGDVTCDGEVSADDVVFLLNYLYRGGPAPPTLC